jgi:endonuclease/exonuclease/phosphatase family metal-dependent hydrolase
LLFPSLPSISFEGLKYNEPLIKKMKKLFCMALLPFLWLLMGCNKGVQPTKLKNPVGMRISTYNIRYESKADDLEGNGWEMRKKPLADVILKHNFDIVGTQEGNNKQLAALKLLLEDFEFIGYPYGGPQGNLHNCATYYKKGLFEVLDQGVFWLSETPQMASVGWDATDTRLCQWIKFKEKNAGKEFYFFNAHFYYRNETARKNSGSLMVAKIKEIAQGSPVIFVGDLNSTPDMEQIATIKNNLKDCMEVSQSGREGFEKTFPGGKFFGEPTLRLDYMFVSDHFKVLDYKSLSDTYGEGRYPSDHFPITSKIVFND